MPGHGEIELRRQVLEHSKTRNHKILENESEFLKKSCYIKYICNNCDGEHTAMMRAYLANKSTGCNNCNTGRGRTRAAAMTPEQRAQRKKIFAERGHKGGFYGKFGPDNSNYKGTTRSLTEPSAYWSPAVGASFGYKCFCTGKKAVNKGDCVAHHLYSRSAFPHLKDDVKNGVWILKEIHDEFHSRYGFGSNTPEQFEEFCRMEYSITTFPWREEGYAPVTPEEFGEHLKVGRAAMLKKRLDLAASRGHTIVEFIGGYRNKESIGVFYCKKHKIFELKSAHNYHRGNLVCCYEKSHRIDPQIYMLFFPKLREHGHYFEKIGFNGPSNIVFNMQTTVCITCPKHKTKEFLTVSEYSKKGLSCCHH